MKVAIGMLYHEANSFNPFLTERQNFVFVEGQSVLERMYATEVFQKESVELIPLCYAVSMPNAIVSKETYEYFAERILKPLREHNDLDGIFLHLHGAMEVEGIGSGELDLLRRIREVVGEDVVIGLAMDPHANNYPGLTELVNVVRAYRTIPHVDQEQTENIVAKHMIRCIKNNIRTSPQFVRIPYAIHAEKALSDVWPLKEIFETLEKLEQEDEISVASVFVGMQWCDCPGLASTVVVTPSTKNAERAKKAAQELADLVYGFRDSFEFSQLPLKPHEVAEYALTYEGSPVYISDSGDNTTGGAVGDHTILLREFLKCREFYGKKVLVTNIWDAKAVKACDKWQEGESVVLDVGSDRDKDSEKVRVEGTLKKKGLLRGYMGCSEDAIGVAVTISVGNVDFVITDVPGSFISFSHFEAAGLEVHDYQVIVVKQGYLFAELSKVAKLAILALTPGATHQIIENLHYERIIQPLYPISTF